ncbi:MAG: valine--tRNA ligase [Oscillospiraceae bacterium]|nr:valine--tRNA ligase [Oscillospiraceae bacterium]
MSDSVNIAKIYSPGDVEGKLYRKWQENKWFHAEPDPEKKPYCIVIPPPNITGQLHMGHALDNTIQDILIRWRRMQGYSTLWMPGTDHASIATEAKLVDALESEGLKKEHVGRDEFLKRAWEWKNIYGSRIIDQLKRLGCSCDWERERFTMDKGLSDAVMEVFIRLYKKGLIYKGERMVNWCSKCGTSISDAEVEYKEKQGEFYYMKYPVKGLGRYVVVATTRPETMLGDTAVAVNPGDARYKDLIGRTAILPLMEREIPIIADDYVDLELGTGAVKITPAHDPNDFEIGLRHNLAQIRVIGEDDIMTADAGEYKGLRKQDARKRVVSDLKARGLIEKITPHTFNLGECYRCNTVIEPLVSNQWFVSMKPLAAPAIEAVKSGAIRFVPDRFSKTYFNWMENIQDWCISRQLWWGHRIPVFYCSECGAEFVAKGAAGACPKCKSAQVRQDENTLDTWFSSALWPFSTLGWPNKTPELDYYYPTSVLVTGYDIIFFWVARMIFSGLEHTGDIPFKHVFIHGIVRDAEGRKMSKSLGNGIDPIDIIDVYGADALRCALTIGISPGNDMRFATEKVESARNFANKIWNASRFVLMNLDGGVDFSGVDEGKYTIADKWILSRMNNLVAEVSDNMENYEMGVALQKIYEFIWEEFCDWYIELVKPRLFDKESDTRLEALWVLCRTLSVSMKLLHPFMPFVSDEIYCAVNECICRDNGAGDASSDTCSMGGGASGNADSFGFGGVGSGVDTGDDVGASGDHSGVAAVNDRCVDEDGGVGAGAGFTTQWDSARSSVMASDWPVYDKALESPEEMAAMELLMDLIKGIRNIRSEMNVPPAKKVNAIFVTVDDGIARILEDGRSFIERLASVLPYSVVASKALIPNNAAMTVARGVEAFLPLDDLIDVEKELARLEKEKQTLLGEVKRAEGKLNNPGFTSNAPEKIVNEEKGKLIKYRDMLEKVDAGINRLTQ